LVKKKKKTQTKHIQLFLIYTGMCWLFCSSWRSAASKITKDKETKQKIKWIPPRREKSW